MYSYIKYFPTCITAYPLLCTLGISSNAFLMPVFQTLISFSNDANISLTSFPTAPPSLSLPKPTFNISLALKSVLYANLSLAGPEGGYEDEATIDASWDVEGDNECSEPVPEITLLLFSARCLGLGSSTASNFPSSVYAIAKTGCPSQRRAERPVMTLVAVRIVSSR